METISFRPLARADFPLVSRWLAAPHVARWWQRPADLASIEQAYGPSIDRTDPTEMFIIEADQTPIGLIKRYRLADYPDWQRAVNVLDAAGIDYLIGEVDLTGKGLGSRTIRYFTAAALERYPELEAVVAAPQQETWLPGRHWRMPDTSASGGPTRLRRSRRRRTQLRLHSEAVAGFARASCEL